MKYILLPAFLFLLCQCRTYHASGTQNKEADTLIKIYAAGFPFSSTLMEEHIIASRYGFYNEELGCSPDEKLWDSLNACNTIAERPLVAKYGKNWKIKYHHDVRVLAASPARAIEQLYFEELVLMKRFELEKHGDTMFFQYKPTKQQEVYYVDAIGRENNKWVSFFQYQVNYVDQKITQKRGTVKSDTSYLHNIFYYSEKDYSLIPR
ncbi:hypothetical protein [Chitinophaga sancti]|uniref:Lipoprotein n=1 Tax=Chitinophaga sancti TaxID=1004 RepID=A0A1K1LQZ5_9BACT|nr:hypothetical protein [Chitinophaga sancti]WQD64916.1 hypothetical protein U0033_10970 [Chitinophaga sancti]WQG89460.1 hypothetical protein SR876_31500 [Chitinophaga sancti]SFW13284.1 hypothetical protein SAMN05661012_00146 [Chitinophaga sancti]